MQELTLEQQAQAAEREHHGALRRAKLALSVLLVSAMGPYVLAGAGLRLEHFIIYGLGSFIVFNAWLSGFYRKIAIEHKLLASLQVIILVALLIRSVFVGNESLGIYKLLADIENHVQPIFLVLLPLALLGPLDAPDCLRAIQLVCRWLAALLSLNTIVILVGFVYDLTPFTSRLVADVVFDTSDTVSAQAAALGRFSGLFNQPFESGVAYSVALFGLLYMLSIRQIKSIFWSIAFLLIMTGGILSVSKVFVIVGVLFSLGYVVWSGAYRAINKYMLMVIVAVGVYGFIALLPQWQAFEYFLRFFDSNSFSEESAISLFTAGRFGSESRIIESAFVEVFEKYPIVGFGMGTREGAIDNGYLEYFYHGGLIVLLQYLLFLFVTLGCAILALRDSRPEGMLAMVLVLFLLAADFGAPTLTVNRSSIFFTTLFITSVVTARKCSRGRPRPPAR